MSTQKLPAPRKGILRFGIVKDNLAIEGRIKVEILEQDHVITRWLPTGHNATLKDKHYSHIPKNSQVVLLMDDNLEDGLVLAAIYSKPDPVPLDPVYGRPRDDTLSGVWYADEENTTDYQGIERFKRGPNNRLTYAKDGTLIRNATHSVVSFSDPGTIHDVAEVLFHVLAPHTVIDSPIICLNGNVTISGVLYMGGVIYGQCVSGGGASCGGTPPDIGGTDDEYEKKPKTFEERMAEWLAKITAPGGGGTGQNFTYKKQDGSEGELFTHHATSTQEVIDYLFCDGATSVTTEGQTFTRPAGWTCKIADYGF